MTMQSDGIHRIAADSVTLIDAIRRVERDGGADNPNRKNREQRQDQKQSSPDETETPHDIVEVSPDYHPGEAASSPFTHAVVTIPEKTGVSGEAAVRGGKPASCQIDIKV